MFDDESFSLSEYDSDGNYLGYYYYRAKNGGKLYVNGSLVEVPEFMGSVPRDFSEITLGEDQYFVMGDNRLTSHDSRASDVGPIHRNMIMGRVRFVLWPLNRIRGIR